MKIVLSRFAFGLAAGLLLLASAGVATAKNPPNYPARPIEKKYYANGTWDVTVSTGDYCCDSSGNHFDLYYPTGLGAGGFKHPILTWANGTNAGPSQYAYLLTHMASWGFVIIATEDLNTGVGQTVLDGANFLIAANSDSTSIFYQKLDVSQVGAFGHSQGATGAINAMVKSGGTIKTVIPIELPEQKYCSSPENCTDGKDVTEGSIFFVDGSADTLIAPPTQKPSVKGEQSIEAYYKAVPRGVAKVKGTLKGPSHNDVQGQPGCTGILLCVNGVYGYLGYPTAWMMANLQGDTDAAKAFVKGKGEILHDNKNWEDVASTIK
jgi:hypothetical protein